MSTPVIVVENLSKLYRLGEVGTGSLAHDVNRWWHRLRGKEDPYTQVGQINDRTKKAESDWVWALKDINFEVKQGEVLGIIGRNGAGKSTLLKILSRVTAPTSGNVKVKGRIAALLEVGTGFHPELTGRENIYLNGAILGMRKAETDHKLDEIIDFSGCEAYLDTPVKRYSSGMQLRLAFAVAAHLDPEILIVDEVLAVGDAEFQKKCMGMMQNVSSQGGRTILFVSHNLHAIAALCQKGMFMANGAIQTLSTMDSVIQDYVSQDKNREGQITWNDAEAPSSERLRILAVRLKSGGVVTSSPLLSLPLEIELDYEVMDHSVAVNVSFHLLDQLGHCILATANLASAIINPDPLGGGLHSVGRYRAVCVLPAHFLNEASYKISGFVLSNITQLEACAPDCLSFRGHDDGEMRKEYTGGWTGMIRPRLHWETSSLI